MKVKIICEVVKMNLILPEFVKRILILIITPLVFTIISSGIYFYMSLRYLGHINLREVFFFFNAYFIGVIGIIYIIYPYKYDIVIHVSLVMVFISTCLLFISIHYNLEFLPFIGYTILFILIILHKMDYLKIKIN